VSGRGEGEPLQPRPFCLAANPRLITQYQLPSCANAPCVYYRPFKSPVTWDFGENLSASVLKSVTQPAEALLVCYFNVRSQPEQMDGLTRWIKKFIQRRFTHLVCSAQDALEGFYIFSYFIVFQNKLKLTNVKGWRRLFIFMKSCNRMGMYNCASSYTNAAACRAKVFLCTAWDYAILNRMFYKLLFL
jgi:hypothetical protein